MTDQLPDPPAEFDVERAAPGDELDVRRVLDAAMLAVDESLPERIAAGDAFVARFRPAGTVVGALVATRPEPGRRHVDAVAVRRARRGRGIGSALVAAAIDDAATEPTIELISAAFAPALRSFYMDLGFDVAPRPSSDDRLWGSRRVPERA